MTVRFDEPGPALSSAQFVQNLKLDNYFRRPAHTIIVGARYVLQACRKPLPSREMENPQQFRAFRGLDQGVTCIYWVGMG